MLNAGYTGEYGKGWMLDPNSLVAEQKAPLDIKINESLGIIKGHLEQFSFVDPTDNKLTSACWVATSRGKDSVVLEHLVLRALSELQMKKIPHILANTLNLYPAELKYWEKFNKRYGFTKGLDFLQMIPPKDSNGKQITVKSVREKNGAMENFRNAKQKVYNEKTGRYVNKKEPDCCFQLKMKSLYNYLQEDGLYLKCSFDGRRAEENQNRRRTILQRCRTYETDHKRPRKIRTCLPLGFWTEDNIHEYIKMNFIPLCPSYKEHDLSRMGCQDCAAYLDWLLVQLKDPSDLGIKTAKRNLEFMQRAEPKRMIEVIEYTIRKIKNHSIVLNPKAFELLDSFRVQQTLQSF